MISFVMACPALIFVVHGSNAPRASMSHASPGEGCRDGMFCTQLGLFVWSGVGLYTSSTLTCIRSFALRNAQKLAREHVDLPSYSKSPRLYTRFLSSPAAAALRTHAADPSAHQIPKNTTCRTKSSRVDLRGGGCAAFSPRCQTRYRSLPQFSTCNVLFELARLFLGPTWADELPASSTADPGRSRSR